MSKKKPRVFLICTGLGHINRGYESFSRECFEALKNSDAFELYLVKGGGKKKNQEIVIPNFSRKSQATGYVSRLLRKEPYHIEQASFCLYLIPLIIRKRPALIYYSDFITGTYLWHLRKYLKFKYRLLFANGAPNGPPYKTEDHVQQLLPVYNSIGVKCDGAGKHTCLPYAFDIKINERINLLQHGEDIRKHLGIPVDKKVILSVGAVNARHKRMDHLVNEVASLNEEYFLVMVGQYDEETRDIITLAEEKLPGRHLITNVAHEAVKNYYIAADIFVLASLREGFPRVVIEALSYGLPCIVHDYVVMRQILRTYGTYIDMRFNGVLSQALINFQQESKSEDAIRFAFDSYSWSSLAKQYRNMIAKQLINLN